MKHLLTSLRGTIRVGQGLIHFNKQVTCCLGAGMDAHQLFKVQPNKSMKNGRAAEARLRTLRATYRVVSEHILAVHVVCAHPVALSGSELCWDPREDSLRDDLHFLLNQQARSIRAALATAQMGALMKVSGRIPPPRILDSRKQ
jgi:hypothetical protein